MSGIKISARCVPNKVKNPLTGVQEASFLVETFAPSHPKLQTRRAVSVPKRDLADRLVKAINAGAAISNPSVKKDLYNKEYVSFDWTIRMRAMNAELRLLGF
jgi:hypothetical protein